MVDNWNENLFFEIPLSEPLVLIGDILIKMYHWGSLRAKKICRMSFNTAFL